MQRARRDRGDPKVRIGEHSFGRRYLEDQASPPARRVERVGQTSERGVSLAQGVDGSISWRAERARRSSFQTTSVSPSWTDFIASNRAGRSIAAPETCSVKIFFASGFGQRLPVARGSDRQWKRRHSQSAWSDSGWRRSPSTLTVRIQFEQTARLGPGGIQQSERRKTPS
jgi:hypothetical protein